MALFFRSEAVASRPSSFALAGCAWPVQPTLLVEGELTDFAGGSLTEAGRRQPEQRRQVLDHPKHMPGLRFRTEIWMLRMAKAWPWPCPSAVQAPCALNLAFPLRPLGFNGGEEDSDSLDTTCEYALAEPGKPRCERPYENGTVLVDPGAGEASTEE